MGKLKGLSFLYWFLMPSLLYTKVISIYEFLFGITISFFGLIVYPSNDNVCLITKFSNKSWYKIEQVSSAF